MRNKKIIILPFFDFKIFFKFVFLVLGFSAFNQFFIGLLSPEGKIYSEFAANHLNYINLISTGVLRLADWINEIIGNPTQFTSPLILSLATGHNVVMGFSCMGLQVMACWISFMVLLPAPFISRVIGTILGLSIIIILNASRISLLLFSISHQWKQWTIIDHHDLFNLVAYTIIIVAIFLYIKILKIKIS